MWTDGKGKEGQRWREGAIEDDRVTGERPTEREREHWRETGSDGESKMRERGREREEFVCAASCSQTYYGKPVKCRRSAPTRLARQAEYMHVKDMFVRGVLLIFLIFLARSDSKVS